MRHTTIPPGTRFTRLVVIQYAGYKGRKSLYKCQCDCGNIVTVTRSNLSANHTKSCGCWDLSRKTTHGKARTNEYSIWQAMTQRCANPNSDSFHLYGGRGITVCARWLEFEKFFADMGPRPSLNHSLDRVDNNKGYTPENVRWSTQKEQNRNMRANVMLTHGGRTLCLTDWANEIGINRATLNSRIIRGWSAEKAITTPFRPWLAAGSQK